MICQFNDYYVTGYQGEGAEGKFISIRGGSEGEGDPEGALEEGGALGVV